MMGNIPDTALAKLDEQIALVTQQLEQAKQQAHPPGIAETAGTSEAEVMDAETKLESLVRIREKLLGPSAN